MKHLFAIFLSLSIQAQFQVNGCEGINSKRTAAFATITSVPPLPSQT
jgi:hypothetical protein